MSRRTSLEAIVSTAIKNSGATKESVAQAADITVAELDSYLSTEGSFPVSVLRRVGGFLRFEAPDVIEESYMPTAETAPPFEIKKDANYTVDESAAWFRCERQQIYAAIRNGRLAAKKLTPTGRKYIVTGAALLAYRDSLTDS